MSKEGPPSWWGGVIEASGPLVPPPPLGDNGLTPAQAPSEVQTAATQRPDNTFDRMENHWGHFLNWYDTRTLQPLSPAYVSTVDSGNMLGCLIALKQGLREKV